MKKLILISIILFTITATTTQLSAQDLPVNIIQVDPPPQVQQAYNDWIANSELWSVLTQIGLYQSLEVFWKISGNGGYNSLAGSYIVPVNFYGRMNDGSIGTVPTGYLGIIIISSDGKTVNFTHPFSSGFYNSWIPLVKVVAA